MKEFFKKHGFVIIFGLLCVTVISIVITINTNNLIYELNYKTELDHADMTSYASNQKMIGYSDNNMSNTPVSAGVENGTLTVKGTITNNTGKTLTLKDFAPITFGGYEFAADVNFEGDGVLSNGATLDVSFEANISTFKNINVLPTTVHAMLGAYDSNNNYHEFDLKYIISWYVN